MNAEQARNTLKNLKNTLAELTPPQRELFETLFSDWCWQSIETMDDNGYLQAYERCINLSRELA